jgi:membrane fusion protein (multidrug efflux system)
LTEPFSQLCRVTERFGQRAEIGRWGCKLEPMMYREPGQDAGPSSIFPSSENNEAAEAGAGQGLSPTLPAVRTPAPDHDLNGLPAVIRRSADEDAGSQKPPAAPRGRRGRKLAIAALAVALTGAAGGYGYHYWTVGRFMVSTDDAYVRAHNTTLAAKVAGYVASVNVRDNVHVHAGDEIARIDDGDFRLAVDAARGKVATQQASVDRIGRQIVAQQANVDQAKAQLTSAKAAAKQAELEFARQQALATKQYASRQALEQAQANRDQASAAVHSAEAAVEAAAANVDVLKAQQQEARRTLAELQTALAKAERDLSFTVIRAPVDGVIGNRAVETGDFVQVGQRLASLVPLDDVYIDANFKETQLARLHVGQPVAISVDALPDHAIEGTVASVAPASGAVFSLLPPDNATGNFTKIVQRIPVRIEVPADVAWRRVLRPGMSVVVSVDTKPSAPTTGIVRGPAQSASTQMD